MASLKSTAEDLGVSVSLVSKVLNNRLGTTCVRPELVEKIHEAADRLGFRKNMSAAALRRGRHDVIGVFVHRFGMTGSGIVEAMVDGIASEAMKSHQKQLLNFFNTTDESEWAFMVRDGEYRCDGCGLRFDPTIAFQRCDDCGGSLTLKRYHYW